MAFKVQQATGHKQITALADRGYFSGDQVLSCGGTGAELARGRGKTRVGGPTRSVSRRKGGDADRQTGAYGLSAMIRF
jgi:hypothetical protein